MRWSVQDSGVEYCICSVPAWEYGGDEFVFDNAAISAFCNGFLEGTLGDDVVIQYILARE